MSDDESIQFREDNTAASDDDNDSVVFEVDNASLISMNGTVAPPGGSRSRSASLMRGHQRQRSATVTRAGSTPSDGGAAGASPSQSLSSSAVVALQQPAPIDIVPTTMRIRSGSTPPPSPVAPLGGSGNTPVSPVVPPVPLSMGGNIQASMYGGDAVAAGVSKLVALAAANDNDDAAADSATAATNRHDTAAANLSVASVALPSPDAYSNNHNANTNGSTGQRQSPHRKTVVSNALKGRSYDVERALQLGTSGGHRSEHSGKTGGSASSSAGNGVTSPTASSTPQSTAQEQDGVVKAPREVRADAPQATTASTRAAPPSSLHPSAHIDAASHSHKAAPERASKPPLMLPPRHRTVVGSAGAGTVAAATAQRSSSAAPSMSSGGNTSSANSGNDDYRGRRGPFIAGSRDLGSRRRAVSAGNGSGRSAGAAVSSATAPSTSPSSRDSNHDGVPPHRAGHGLASTTAAPALPGTVSELVALLGRVIRSYDSATPKESDANGHTTTTATGMAPSRSAGNVPFLQTPLGQTLMRAANATDSSAPSATPNAAAEAAVAAVGDGQEEDPSLQAVRDIGDACTDFNVRQRADLARLKDQVEREQLSLKALLTTVAPPTPAVSKSTKFATPLPGRNMDVSPTKTRLPAASGGHPTDVWLSANVAKKANVGYAAAAKQTNRGAKRSPVAASTEGALALGLRPLSPNRKETSAAPSLRPTLRDVRASQAAVFHSAVDATNVELIQQLCRRFGVVCPSNISDWYASLNDLGQGLRLPRPLFFENGAQLAPHQIKELEGEIRATLDAAKLHVKAVTTAVNGNQGKENGALLSIRPANASRATTPRSSVNTPPEAGGATMIIDHAAVQQLLPTPGQTLGCRRSALLPSTCNDAIWGKRRPLQTALDLSIVSTPGDGAADDAMATALMMAAAATANDNNNVGSKKPHGGGGVLLGADDLALRSLKPTSFNAFLSRGGGSIAAGVDGAAPLQQQRNNPHQRNGTYQKEEGGGGGGSLGVVRPQHHNPAANNVPLAATSRQKHRPRAAVLRQLFAALDPFHRGYVLRSEIQLRLAARPGSSPSSISSPQPWDMPQLTTTTTLGSQQKGRSPSKFQPPLFPSAAVDGAVGGGVDEVLLDHLLSHGGSAEDVLQRVLIDGVLPALVASSSLQEWDFAAFALVVNNAAAGRGPFASSAASTNAEGVGRSSTPLEGGQSLSLWRGSVNAPNPAHRLATMLEAMARLG